MPQAIETAALHSLPPLPAMPRALGSVGPWVLESLVGEGSFSKVYQARSKDASAQSAAYAVKLLKSETGATPQGLDLLRREALVGGKVSHAHLVPILAHGLNEPPYYLVMPYLTGETLARRLTRGPLPLPLALWIARQVAEGLGALHAGDWMHGDIKPANILVSPAGHATVLDFGFARRIGQPGSHATRPLAGTLLYVAPELVTSALRCDIRSDLYSLGAVLFEMLAGRPPFEAASAAELATQHRQQTPRDIRSLVPQLPLRVAQLVRQMLAKDPLRRPQSPSELVARLAQLEIDALAEWSFDNE